MIIFNDSSKIIVINDIIATTKIFNGDVFGGAVRDFQVNGKARINDIDIRLDSIYFKPFMTLMSTKYTIQPIYPNKKYNGILIETFYISSPKDSFAPINLDIVLLNKHIFKISFIDFDVNLLSENEKALYVRYVPNMIKYIPDKLNYIKNRIKLQKFSAIPFIRDHKDLYKIVNKAYAMTQMHWIMDDSMYVKETWIMGKWEGFLQGIHKKKISLDKLNYECSLCHEKFQNSDIVLSTACNHVFHWHCNHANTGLSEWAKNHSSCPYCRSDMFATN